MRIISGIIMIALLIVLVFFAPSIVGVAFMAIATFLATKELLSISLNEKVKSYRYIFACISTVLPLLIYFAPNFVEIYSIFSIVFVIFLYLKEHESINYNDTAYLVIAIFLLPQALNAITKLYLLENGKILILIPMITAWGSDILAYFVGKNLGKHKLAPKISPKKTIEGSIGGVLGGVLGMVAFSYFTNSSLDFSIILFVLIGAIGAVFGQMGDLCFSMIKRQCGVKDYSNLIPGHGGVLDRFDSVIFTAPIAFALLSLI